MTRNHWLRFVLTDCLVLWKTVRMEIVCGTVPDTIVLLVHISRSLHDTLIPTLRYNSERKIENNLKPLCTNGFFLLVWLKKTWDGPLYILRGHRLKFPNKNKNFLRIYFVWFDSLLPSQKLCQDGSFWVEPVLSKDLCVLLKDTTQWPQWGLNQALYHRVTPFSMGIVFCPSRLLV